MSQESTMKIKLKTIIVAMSWRRYLQYQYRQGFRDNVLHKRQGQLSGIHAFIIFLNSIKVGEFLISYGNNFCN